MKIRNHLYTYVLVLLIGLSQTNYVAADVGSFTRFNKDLVCPIKCYRSYASEMQQCSDLYNGEIPPTEEFNNCLYSAFKKYSACMKTCQRMMEKQ